nr:MAG TPA: hypothetical protein [Caudoviricetes sp.]DAK97345.1 MAG TPA: hypothetical protein [Caudoviricetes sp.]
MFCFEVAFEWSCRAFLRFFESRSKFYEYLAFTSIT